MSISWNDLKLIVDGKEMPAPTDFEVEMNDLDGDSVRNVKDGVLSRVVVRQEVKKFTLKYSMTEMETLSAVLNMLRPKKLSVQYFNPSTLTRTTGSMYCNTKTYGLVCVGENAWAKTMNFSIVEY